MYMYMYINYINMCVCVRDIRMTYPSGWWFLWFQSRLKTGKFSSRAIILQLHLRPQVLGRDGNLRWSFPNALPAFSLPASVLKSCHVMWSNGNQHETPRTYEDPKKSVDLLISVDPDRKNRDLRAGPLFASDVFLVVPASDLKAPSVKRCQTVSNDQMAHSCPQLNSQNISVPRTQ